VTEPIVGDVPDLNIEPVDKNRARSLGDRLRRAFDEVIAEPLPEAFAELLRRLE
jgi:hypothetical protein